MLMILFGLISLPCFLRGFTEDFIDFDISRAYNLDSWRRVRVLGAQFLALSSPEELFPLAELRAELEKEGKEVKFRFVDEIKGDKIALRLLTDGAWLMEIRAERENSLELLVDGMAPELPREE